MTLFAPSKTLDSVLTSTLRRQANESVTLLQPEIGNSRLGDFVAVEETPLRKTVAEGNADKFLVVLD